MQVSNKTTKIVMTALMMCMIMVATMFIRVPIPFTQGYVHLGDAMIFLAVLIVGWKYGAVAAAVGCSMADIIGGFAMWAPWTFVIKAIMAIVMGLFIQGTLKFKEKNFAGFPVLEILGMIIAGIIMVAGYYIAEGLMYGNWIVPLAGIPWNAGQFAAGMVIASIIGVALSKTPARRYFAYKLN
ncbi:MAG: ECF transporter S component [Anaerovoracaceae bacterium]